MVVYQVYPKKKKSMSGFWGSLSLNTKLISLNVLCFVVFWSLMGAGVLSIDEIAIKPSNIFAGKYLWTFITSMFMHANFTHLFLNMLSLYFVGSLLEKILGRKRYLRFYILAGLFSGLLFVASSLFIPGDVNTYAVGASGAIFGLIGVLMFLTPNLPVYIMFIPIPVKLKYAAPAMLVLLWVISLAANIPIGNVAHLGGLFAGIFYGLILRYKFPRKVGMIQNHFR